MHLRKVLVSKGTLPAIGMVCLALPRICLAQALVPPPLGAVVVPANPLPAGPVLSPAEAAYRQALLDDVEISQKLNFPTAVTSETIQNLTARDLDLFLQVAAEAQAQFKATSPGNPLPHGQINPATLKLLSSAGAAAVRLVIPHEGRKFAASRPSAMLARANEAIAATMPELHGQLSPAASAYKQALLDDIALFQKLNFPIPAGPDLIQALTPSDLQAFAALGAQTDAKIKAVQASAHPVPMSLSLQGLGDLSPAGLFAMPLVITREQRRYQAAFDQLQRNTPSVDPYGNGPTGGPVTADQGQAYLHALDSHPFCPPWPPSNQPPVLQETVAHDQTENDWIARLIVQDIAAQIVAGLHLPQRMNDVHVEVQTEDDDPLHGVLHINLRQWIDNPAIMDERLNAPYHVDFAWDGQGYASLATYLLGTHAPPVSVPDPQAGKLMGNLLNLTGPSLAREDVRLSSLLQKNPLAADAQAEAALLLVALAWRENADAFSDTRQILCKAAAHLALATALNSRRQKPPDWNALVADVGLRVLAGREADGIGRIDGLITREDIPASAKMWLTTLRFFSTGDWRQAQVTADSPLLAKIAWFQVLCDDLPDLAATSRLDKLGRPASIPDWGRALFSGLGFSVENGNRFAQSTLALELKETADISQEEGVPIADEQDLIGALTAMEGDTVVFDPHGNTRIEVVGRSTFMAASRRHVLDAIQKIDTYLRKYVGDPDGAAAFEAQMVTSFQQVPYFGLVAYAFPNPDGGRHANVDDTLRERNAKWELPALPPSLLVDFLATDFADMPAWNRFYNAGEPIGTVYDLDRRTDTIGRLHIDAHWHLPPTEPLPDRINQSKRRYYEQLRPLNPVSCVLAEAVVLSNHDVVSGDTTEQAITELASFMKYSVAPFQAILNGYPPFHLSDEQREALYTQEAVLKPDVYFALGQLLRSENRADDAAADDRRGAALAYDQVGVANSVGPLIDYDLAHDQEEEALEMARRASEVGSEQGLWDYMSLLERFKHLDKAETVALEIKERYDDDKPLTQLYAANEKHFLRQVVAFKRQYFPAGMKKVSLSSFSKPPEQGDAFTTSSPILTDAGLQTGDVVVALNSIKIDNDHQYTFVREQLPAGDTDMDLIVWHQNQYCEIHASPPSHFFGVTMSDYPVR
jgi:hypothetical protein